MTPEEVVQAVVGKSETMTRPVFRGQANCNWWPESGAVRRLRQTYGEDLPTDKNELWNLVNEYHKEHLITPMQIMDGAKQSDLKRLSVLQHQGAATGFLDFTESPLIALWFAVYTDEELLDSEHAKVFVLDVGNPQTARNGRMLERPFDAGQPTVYYEPDHSLGTRIIAQRSVFVICNPLIPDNHIESVVIPRESKCTLRRHLKQLGLSQTTLFCDIPGLAAANATSKPLQRKKTFKPEQYRDRGRRAYQAGRYDDALDAYESYAEAMPDVAQPHCLKGDLLAELGQFKEANLAYTKGIENLDRPIYLGEKAVVNHKLVSNLVRPTLYYNRGNVRAATGDYHGAVADFDVALQSGYHSKRNVLKNRGNSKFALQMFTEAYQDFRASSVEESGSDVSLAMGNCKTMMGNFKHALQRYLAGTGDKSERSAVHCGANAEQIHRILETLDGHDYQIQIRGILVFVETAHVREQSAPFPFAGNQGNTGNTPSGMITTHGGKGYEGLNGFAVVIAPLTS